jgi:hypothetical protein
MVGPQGIVRPGGLLMLTTPFSWKEEFTRKVRRRKGEGAYDLRARERIAQYMSHAPSRTRSTLDMTSYSTYIA